MAPNEFPVAPSSDEFLRMMKGPWVNIYAGEEKKHYEVPKMLLCHYSPYFDRFLNDGSYEAENQEVDLSEDCQVDFDLLLEYMLNSGSLLQTTVERNCYYWYSILAFIEFADKYGMGVVGSQILLPYVKFELKPVEKLEVTTSQIELMFKVFPNNHPLRRLTTILAMDGRISGDKFLGGITEEELAIEGFAVAVLKELQSAIFEETEADEELDKLLGVQK